VTELQPCPFCSGKAVIDRMGTNRVSMQISCEDCGASIESGETWINEHSKWNTRAPINKDQTIKDFDITQHEWSDTPIKYLDNDASGVELEATESAWFVNFYLDKSDAIALAKHFKLTPEDLT